MSDIDVESDLDSKIQEEFYNNIEGEIYKHPAEFKRSLGEIKSTTVSVKRVDPLTGEADVYKRQCTECLPVDGWY